MIKQRGIDEVLLNKPRDSCNAEAYEERHYDTSKEFGLHGNCVFSHIRSSEDVSSGYSSAEPLYAGHHVTQSEGLASSREPLVRTASVGCTRSMRTKSLRGGSAAKRGPVAEVRAFYSSEIQCRLPTQLFIMQQF